MHRILQLFVGVFLFAITSVAQPPQPKVVIPQSQAGPPTRASRVMLPDLLTLEVRETKILRHDGATALGDLSCDREGNPYFASRARLNGDPTWVVTRWDLNENKLARFVVNDSTGLAGFHWVRGYGVGPDGTVYMPIWTLRKGEQLPEFYVAEFKKDGSFDKKIRISEDIAMLQLGVFPSGNFLVVAGKADRTRSDPPQPREYLTAIYRSDGQLLREINSPVDTAIQAGIKNADPIYTNPTMSAPNDRTIEMGSSHVGPDGFVYAMRRSTAALVNVYSEAGELVRTLKVEPPVEDYRPAWFQVASGLVAVYFRPEGNAYGVFVVVDSQTGERRAIFDGAGHSQAFACFAAPYKFTLLTATADGQLSAEILEPKR